MDYEAHFGDAVTRIRGEGRYRIFCDLARRAGDFPAAERYDDIVAAGFHQPPARAGLVEIAGDFTGPLHCDCHVVRWNNSFCRFIIET